MSEPTLYDQLGGEPVLRRIIDRFIDRVFEDAMIGFFFKNVSRSHLKEKEFELAAEHLGGPIKYSGRPLDKAHARHPIMGGQFMRRLQILKDTLAEFEVPEHIVQHFETETERLRPLVTGDEGGHCDDAAARTRAENHGSEP